MNTFFSLFMREFLNSIENEEMYKDLEKEEQVFEKGDFKTTITSYFSKDGYLISTITKTISKAIEPTSVEEELNNLKVEKDNQLELDTSEGYIKAAEIQKKIETIERELEKNKV